MLANTESITVRESKQVSAQTPVLTVRYYLSPDRANDKVYLANGNGYFFSHWLAATDSAVKTMLEVVSIPSEQLTRTQYVEGLRARAWLRACGVYTRAQFDRLVSETLPLLHLPADSPLMARRCEHCGSKIWGREAVLTGLGSECRRATKKARRQIAAMGAK